jgi:hypothetical protein
VNVSATTEPAEEWGAGEQLEADVVSAADLAAEAAEMWRPVVGSASPPTN